MQTNIAEEFHGTPVGDTAESVLRKCVHCGFCLATCPTYQLLGDELDSPRGRIYQIKQVIEGAEATAGMRLHLDRCLTCRACETTCPSGVEYGKLVDIGRQLVEEKTRRGLVERAQRALLVRLLSDRRLASLLFAVARAARPLLPQVLSRKIVPRQKSMPTPGRQHLRRVVMLDGCVQPSLTPRTNQAAAQLLDRLGIHTVTVREAGCCGALAHHLSYEQRALAQARRNIDAWWPHIENGVEAIIITASGCGVMVSDYGYLLRGDAAYADRAARVSALVRDLSQVIDENRELDVSPRAEPVAYHSPCTYQHGLGLGGRVEAILSRLGYRLTPVSDAHLCCGSAGTYSLLQPKLSARLLDNKLANLAAGDPRYIVTANVGCQTHLASKSGIPVLHWAEMLAEDLAAPAAR
ncbi:MAG: glycolate oxidase iron-sulfur subunit [Proteobacteria bacterium]|nr:MAG: glycolate oxidase iron-sulfur subunit [Pseudomonadota bacterium]